MCLFNNARPELRQAKLVPTSSNLVDKCTTDFIDRGELHILELHGCIDSHTATRWIEVYLSAFSLLYSTRGLLVAASCFMFQPPLFWKSSWIIQPGFRNSIAKTLNCAASKSFLLLACCFMGNVLTHSTYHCCHAQRQNALSSLSKVCSSLMTYVQLRNLT